MSNYLAIIAPSDICSKIISDLRVNPEDVASRILNDEFSLIFIARRARELNNGSGPVFKGYAIDFGNETVVCGQGGRDLIDDLEQTEGCYISIDFNRGGVTVRNDSFSQLPMMWTRAPRVAAISDSVLALVTVRRFLGMECALHREATAARAWTNSISDQLVGSNSIIDGIRMSPPLSGLSLSFEDGLRVESHPADYAAEALSAGDYNKTVLQGAQRLASLVTTLAQCEAPMSLALSGGMDSRLMLAAMMTKRELLGEININSHPDRKRDYQIVSNLAERYRLNIGRRSKPSPERVKIPGFTLWGASSAGVYDPLYFPNQYPSTVEFSIGGHGAGIYKGAYRWRTMQRISRHIRQEEVLRGFSIEVSNCLAEIGIDWDAPDSSEWHYMRCRNSLHSGRSAMNNMFGLRPILQRDLFRLSKADSSARHLLVKDMMIALAPDLATQSFDDAGKNIMFDRVEERSRAVGRISSDDVSVYRILGDIQDVISGPPSCFLEWSAGLGYRGGLDREGFRQLARAGLAKARGPLSEPYTSLFAEISANIENGAPIRSIRGLGKFLALNLAD